MVCTTIVNRDCDGIWDVLCEDWLEMAEIRLDTCKLTLEEIDDLFSSASCPLVATCRISDKMTPQKAETRLIRAIHAGANFVDLEIEAPPMMSKRIRREAQEYGTTLIRSYHNMEETESETALHAIVEKCLHLGADIVKIATMAHSKEDVDRVMSLYDRFDPNRLIAFCMAFDWKESRVECLAKGAPFSYAAASVYDNSLINLGQWPSMLMADAIYGDFPMYTDAPLEMPASKSMAQRAVLCAALAEGTSTLEGFSTCADTEAAIGIAKALGAKITKHKDELTITGIGPLKEGSLDISELHAGESGFSTRFMIPIVSFLSKNDVTITGEKTLLTRPLKGAKDIMEAFGVKLNVSEDGEVHVPVTINGHIRSGEAEISGKNGSQLISGLVTALALANGESTIYVNDPKSIPYIFMTLDVLKKFGVKVACDMEGGQEFIETHNWDLCERLIFHIKGGQKLKACKIKLEKDWSAAANFAVAGALFGDVALFDMPEKSVQADLSILDILADAGTCITQEPDPDTGNDILAFTKAPLVPLNVDAGNCPDLFPILSIVAAFCEGESHISGVGRLATKESDRGKAIVDMLTGMGVKAAIKGDELVIEGHSLARRLLTKTLLKRGKYSSNHDHRMVMALSIASIGADGPIEIDDTECVVKSWPEFFKNFENFKKGIAI